MKTLTIRSKHPLGGFSLVEMLVAMTAITVLAGVAFVSMQGVNKASREKKLSAQVESLNAAVQVYLANGGTIGDDLSATEVTDKLKRRSLTSTANKIVGLRGSFIDPRLTAVTAVAKTGEARAVWNATSKRFVVDTGIAGVSHWVLGEMPAADFVAEEQRATALEYAANDQWVWDYNDYANTSATGPLDVTTTDIGAGNPLDPFATPNPTQLSQPVLSRPEGTYEIEIYDEPIYIQDTNIPGSAAIFYSINGSDYELYTGDPIFLDDWPAEISAYAVSIDPDKWTDSDSTTNNYSVIRDPGVEFETIVSTSPPSP